MNVALIPARGGSKRIPRKNIAAFAGKPIIVWSIEAALASGCFDRVIVSTDDREIADLARDAGAEIPFDRPAELADDHATTIDVVRHALDALARQGVEVDKLCCLYATAPFVEAADLRAGLDLLDRTGADFAMSVTEFDFPIERGCRVDGDGVLTMIRPECFLTRSQDLEEAVHDAGQLYWGTRRGWLERTPTIDGRTVALRLPRHRVQDIDTAEDWTRAELMFEALRRTDRP